MRNIIWVSVMLCLCGGTFAFELQGFMNGQSRFEVKQRLTELGYQIDQELGDDMYFTGAVGGGWAVFCGNELQQITLPRTYGEFLSLLREETVRDGSNAINAVASPNEAGEMLVFFTRIEGQEAHGLALTMAEGEVPRDVWENRALLGECASAANNSLQADRP